MTTQPIFDVANFFKGKKKVLLFYAFLAVAKGLLLVPLPLILQALIETLTSNSGWLWPSFLLGVLLAVNLLSVVLAVISQTGIVKNVKDAIKRIRLKLSGAAIDLPVDTWSRQPQYVKDIIVNETERLDIALTVALGQFFPSIISSLLLLLFIFSLSPLLTLISLFLIPASFLIVVRNKQKVSKALQVFKKQMASFDIQIEFLLKYWELIKIQSSEVLEKEKTNVRITKLHRVSYELAVYQIYLQGFQESIGVIFSVGLLAIGFFLSSIGQISGTDVIVFFVGFSLIRIQLNTLFSTWPQIITFKQSVDSLNQLGNTLVPIKWGRKKHSLKGNLRINEVSLELNNKKIISSLSLEIAPKKLSVLSGANGQGKTSLLKILLGLITPSRGQVLIDDKDLTSLDLRFYRKQVGVVTQSPLFVNGSLIDNLVYGSTLAKAGFKNHSSSLEKSLENLKAQKIQSFSGGEKQKAAILRALKRHPKILFLDEPTNHLDAINKKVVISDILKSKPMMTILCITHDPLLIEKADTHYHLNKGKLLKVK